MKKEWVMQIKEQCIEQDIPFYFKQWGGVNKKKNGRLLEARTWDEMPIPMNINALEKEIEHNKLFHLPLFRWRSIAASELGR